jgi:hypothetical protein
MCLLLGECNVFIRHHYNIRVAVYSDEELPYLASDFSLAVLKLCVADTAYSIPQRPSHLRLCAVRSTTMNRQTIIVLSRGIRQRTFVTLLDRAGRRRVSAGWRATPPKKLSPHQ